MLSAILTSTILAPPILDANILEATILSAILTSTILALTILAANIQDATILAATILAAILTSMYDTILTANYYCTVCYYILTLVGSQLPVQQLLLLLLLLLASTTVITTRASVEEEHLSVVRLFALVSTDECKESRIVVMFHGSLHIQKRQKKPKKGKTHNRSQDIHFPFWPSLIIVQHCLNSINLYLFCYTFQTKQNAAVHVFHCYIRPHNFSFGAEANNCAHKPNLGKITRRRLLQFY